MRNLLLAGFLLTSLSVFAQGTLVYDQQSATNGLASGGAQIQAFAPVGQSFTPTSTFVGFAQFQLFDTVQNNGIGATVVVNLRENSIAGNLLGTTDPASVPNNFLGTATFFFPANIPVTSGTQYFFELLLQSGDDPGALSDFYNYLGGDAYVSGQPSPIGKDLWFREGYVVPEPSVCSLVVLGSGLFLWRFRRRR